MYVTIRVTPLLKMGITRILFINTLLIIVTLWVLTPALGFSFILRGIFLQDVIPDIKTF